MRYLAFASDYDGTLADEDVVSPSTFAALKRLKASGRKLILVTGRELDELLQTFPAHWVFERIVTDNGAVVYSPANGRTVTLADPPPQKFIDALRQKNVEPLGIGRVIVATVESHRAAVLGTIRELGLPLQVAYNKGSVMVLPAGTDKATGLLAALSDLGLSERQTVGVGDGENDEQLLKLCACGVAVANATPGLKECADIIMTESGGKGVQELIDRLLLNDLSDIEVRQQSSERFR
ncbi:MAG: HAD family hydrolase [Candidatus Acidiferrales bacterium]